ncbi:MAG TPA: PfkB family carbohydrate kinase, partial [Kofleriaceae bacterium]|nr:PfkB family carbohydrate kinase [Kofleriaceae bacterium]
MAGGWARLVSRVGDDEAGRRAVARLAEHVDTSLVQIDPERKTGEVTVRLEGGEPRYTLHPGRAWERIQCTEAVREALGEASVLVYGTLAQRAPEGLAGWRAAARAAAASCLRVCDLNLRPTDEGVMAIREALEAADVVKVNDRELASLRDRFGWADPIAALRRGRARVVAVTHGADGSTLFGEGARAPIEIPGAPAAPGGDHVGCGDAYLAILVHGMTLGWDLAASGRAASRWATAVAGARGATPAFSEEQIADLLEGA